MARAATPDILAGLGQADDGGLAAAMGPQAERVATVKIRLDGGTQPRAGIDQAVVDDYYQDMANGAQFPPVELVYDGADYWLWDGFHRFAAFRRDGDRAIPAHVRQGTRRDAVLLSVGANATHGFRRTNADKRRSVMALLEDEEWRQWSDREIARRCAVSDRFVNNVRAQLSANGSQIETRRVERNGTEYTMTPAQRTPAPEPYDVMELVEEMLALDSVALDGVDEDWLFEYMESQGKRQNRTFDRRDFDFALGEATRRQIADNVRRQHLENARNAAIAADAQRPTPSAKELWGTLTSRLQILWARPNGGEMALRELLDELDQPGFPYVGKKDMWRRFEAWYKDTYRGEWQPSMWDTREVLRKISPAPAPATQPASTLTTPPPLGNEMVFDQKLINQGKTIKIFGRNMNGTLTVTLDKDKLHLYSPGVTMTPGDAYDLTVRMQRALAQIHLAKQKETTHA